ncbi:MAG: hypothetical protein IKR64_01985 [Treponema sp.]|nr:hypothetical protein [Treponema sp.]
MKKNFLLPFLILILFSPRLFAAQGIELTNINAAWTRVLPGKPVCQPQTTSYGFAVMTDAHNLMAFTSQGSIVFEKTLSRTAGGSFGVLENDFFALVTGSSKRLTLLNPDGRELWNTSVDFKITAPPKSGRDGRFFVRGTDTLACYSITGIQKWKTTTPPQSKLELQELPDGSLIVFLEELDQGKSKALRLTPFGQIVEKITFAGQLVKALTTPQGILLVFTDGSAGLFDLVENTSTHKWLFKKDKILKNSSDFFILSQNKKDVIYVNIKSGQVEIDCIDLTDGSIKDYFIIEQAIIPQFGWYNDSGVFISDGKEAFFYNNAGRYLWSGSLPDSKSKEAYIYTGFTSDNCFLLFSSNWSIYAFRTAHAPEQKNSGNQTNIQSPDYSSYYDINTSLLELSFPMPIDKELLQPERFSLLSQGGYGQTEALYLSQLLSVCQAYKNVMSTTNFGTRVEKSVLQTDTTATENIFSQLSLFGTDTFCDYTAYFLRRETNKSLILTLLQGISANGYDPQGKLMASLEYLARNSSEKDETILKELCNALYSICRTMGTYAIEPAGKDILSSLMYPKYTSTVRDYARDTLKKLVGK